MFPELLPATKTPEPEDDEELSEDDEELSEDDEELSEDDVVVSSVVVVVFQWWLFPFPFHHRR